MAINAVILEPMVQLIRQLGRPLRMAALGYPDLLLTETQAAGLCGGAMPPGIRYRDDAQAILRWHGLEGLLPGLIETGSFFRALGVDIEFLDIAASRGVEMIVDLNQTLPEALACRYDIVYDGGTMEHCFNVGQVMRNICTLLKPGGFVVHVNPLNYYNHGFFAFNPTFYHDFYTQNGHRLASPIYGLYGSVLDSRAVVLPATEGFRELPERCAVMILAQKLHERQPEWPMQSKYQNNSDLKA